MAMSALVSAVGARHRRLSAAATGRPWRRQRRREQPKRGRVVFYDEASLEFLADCIPSAVRRAARARIFARCTPQEAEELAQTVALYFAEDGDVRRCAEKLFVHRNTFQYRMDTVKRKTGLDLRRPRDAALLYLVLRQ